MIQNCYAQYTIASFCSLFFTCTIHVLCLNYFHHFSVSQNIRKKNKSEGFSMLMHLY